MGSSTPQSACSRSWSGRSVLYSPGYMRNTPYWKHMLWNNISDILGPFFFLTLFTGSYPLHISFHLSSVVLHEKWFFSSSNFSGMQWAYAGLHPLWRNSLADCNSIFDLMTHERWQFLTLTAAALSTSICLISLPALLRVILSLLLPWEMVMHTTYIPAMAKKYTVVACRWLNFASENTSTNSPFVSFLSAPTNQEPRCSWMSIRLLDSTTSSFVADPTISFHTSCKWPEKGGYNTTGFALAAGILQFSLRQGALTLHSTSIHKRRLWCLCRCTSLLVCISHLRTSSLLWITHRYPA